MRQPRQLNFRLVGDEPDRWRAATIYDDPQEHYWLSVFLGDGDDGLEVVVNTDQILEYFEGPRQVAAEVA